MKKDVLFTSWNCPECSEVKNVLDMNFAMDDEKLGKDSQHLVMIQAFSNVGARVSIDQFTPDSKEDLYTPLVISHDGQIIKELDEILNYLKDQGFTK
jgi:hypothetical protein